MPKRKRDDGEDGVLDQIEDRALRIKASRLKAKLEQSNKSLKDAIQLARGFERQKLGRRQKQAENQPHTLLRLREELILVKELDPTKTAKNYLFKQLVKTKRIKESPVFVALFGVDPRFESPKSAAEANVLGRLFKSNPVKEILPGILQTIRDLLAPDNAKPSVQNGAHGSKLTAAADETETLDQDVFSGFSDGDEDIDVDVRNRLLDGIWLDEASTSNNSTSEGDSTDEDRDEMFAAYRKRLAGSSDDSDGDNERNAYHDIKGAGYHDRHVPTPSSSESDSDRGAHQQSATLTRKTATSKTPNKTAFLPSLSMGGYYSGSEFDPDDIFNTEEGITAPPQRKNRRGQRARREIAAKKYGQNAKHLLTEAKQGSKSRGVGWDPKRGAVEGRRGGRSSSWSKGITGANGDAVNMANANARQAVKKVDAPLHPSWEAARKKKIESVTASFSGKKITFD